MESHQYQSWFPSRQQLLEDLENLITIESARKNNPWISVEAHTEEVFVEKKN